MKIIEFIKNKIVLIFGVLFFTIIFMLISILNLISDRNIINKKLNAYNTEISILEENRKLEENWRELEDAIKEKKELIENEEGKLELLVENKLNLEKRIQENRRKFFGENGK